MPRKRKMGRKIGPRRALLRNQVTSLLKIERMETTEAKAREVKRLTDRMITLAKRGDLHARRQALAFLMDEDVVTKLLKNRPSHGGEKRRLYQDDQIILSSR